MSDNRFQIEFGSAPTVVEPKLSGFWVQHANWEHLKNCIENYQPSTSWITNIIVSSFSIFITSLFSFFGLGIQKGWFSTYSLIALIVTICSGLILIIFGAIFRPYLIKHDESERININECIRAIEKIGMQAQPQQERMMLDKCTTVTNQSQPTKKELKIISAKYGANDKWLDITEKLNMQIKDSQLDVQIGNKFAGSDPIQGVPKTTKVRYTYGGVEAEKEIAEDETLTLPEVLPKRG